MRLKVVLVDYYLPASTYSLELCRELAKLCDLTMICKNNYQPEDNLPFQVHPILHTGSKNAYDQISGYTRDLLGIYRIVKEVKPDVLHLEQFVHQIWETILVKRLKKYTKVNVFTLHNLLSHEAKAKEKEKLNKWYRLFDGLVAHNKASEAVLRELSDYSGSVCVMPHGCYSQYQLLSPPRQDDRITFLQFGLIREYKGVDILIEAIAMLPPQVREKCRFIIAGKPFAHYQYDIGQHVEELGLGGCVDLMLRRIEDDEMSGLFSQADACLFPYRSIYGSGALMMAYTFEKPVIASNIPTFVEETENGRCGLLFESENPGKLRDAIVKFCELLPAEREAYAKNVAALKNEKYSWKKSSELVIDFYHSLIENKS